MVEPPASNQASGSVTGTVVQAGAIQHLTVTSQPTALGNGWVVPRQLPLAVRDFTGRTEYLVALDALLPDDKASDGDTAGAVVISAVDGTGGIGKTTLAVHWAHRVQHRFPDGTLHVNLRGYGPGEPATPGEALDGFLRALGVPAERMPSGVEAQAALFRSLLAGRRVLIVLDNANSADQVRPLLPGSPGCVVVVTSRDRLTGLVITEGASRLTLDLLTEPEALELVRSILGPNRAAAEARAISELVRWCARLPLALRIAATRAAQPHTTVQEVIAELADESGPLEALSRDTDERAAVRVVFEWSYRRLNHDQARLFRLLSLHPGTVLSVHAAAAVAAIEPSEARVLLDHLTAAHLLESATSGRYRFHDLLRAYAADLSERYDQPDTQRQAFLALMGWYTYMAYVCDSLSYAAHPRWSQWTLPKPANPLIFNDRSAARHWLEVERNNLLAILRHSVLHEPHPYALHLADSMRFLFWVGGLDDLLAADTMGLAGARYLGQFDAESYFQARRGEALVYLQRWDEALVELQQSLMAARNLQDSVLTVQALSQVGLLLVKQARFEEALPYLQEALPMSRGVDTGRWEGVVEGIICRAYGGLGLYREALEHGERQLAIRRNAGDLPGEPLSLHQVAQVRQALDDHATAIALCREAIDLGRQYGDLLVMVAGPLETLAISLRVTGQAIKAIECWEEAVIIYQQYGRTDEAAQAQAHIHEVHQALAREEK